MGPATSPTGARQERPNFVAAFVAHQSAKMAGRS